MISFTINDIPVEAKQGTTVLRAALDNGIYIPHFCYDKRLEVYGGCRLCLVDIKGGRKLVTSCTTTVQEGMEVYTETPKVVSARRTVLELLLVHHPLECPICDKAGECDLQDLAFKYGAAEGRFSGKKKKDPERLDAPLIQSNTNRCILCGKCVKVCFEHQGVGAIELIDRGFKTKVSAAFEETLSCEFCGQCVDICPVGARNSGNYRHVSRAWYLDDHDMPCPYCGCGCITTLGIREGKIVRAKGVQGRGQNDGNLCSRGRYGFDYISSPERLTSPLIRREILNNSSCSSNSATDIFEEVSWDEALEFISKRLSKITSEHGAEKVGAIGSQRCTVEDNFMLQKFIREHVQSSNVDSAAHLGYLKASKAFESVFGQRLKPVSWDAPLSADFMLVVESDITSLLPVWGLRFIESKRRGSRLVVADPKKTKLSRHSNSWLRIKPGSGTALINGMINVLLREELYNKQAAEDAAGFIELRTSIMDFTPEVVSGIIGIPAEELVNLARDYAASGNRIIAITSSASENTKSSSLFIAAANMARLMGDGPESIQVPAEHSNTMGMIAAGVQSGSHGKNIHEMLYNPDALKALYIMGEDPLVMLPDVIRIEDNLKKLDLLVVQDIFMTDTAKMADVVLPAAAWSEKEGHFISATGNIQKLDNICRAPGDAKPDWEVFSMLIKKMDKSADYLTFEAVSMEALLRTSAFMARLETCNREQEFVPADLRIVEEPDDQYPFILVASTILQHSGAFSMLSRNLDAIVSDPYIQINSIDAARLSIEPDTFVEVSSKRGSAVARAVVSDEVPEGVLFAPVHFSSSKINALTYPATDDGVPLVAARIAKI
ncbi:MAG: molybdopterin-dependent oxidoreductase [Dissulfurispiraceae bacterium]|nr:molybdopterin-dependent oxidoreductase [Dissulfurispiraceae bacterium]